MLPYLVLAGPVAVLMGVLNANHRFHTAALAAVIFNVVILIALRRNSSSHGPATATCRLRLVAFSIACAGLCQLALVGLRGLDRPGESDATRISASRRSQALCRARHSGTDRQRHSATHHDRRGDGRVGLARRRVMAVLRQPPGRIAARHCRHCDRHGDDAGADARDARRRSRDSRRALFGMASKWRSGLRCPPQSRSRCWHRRSCASCSSAAPSRYSDSNATAAMLGALALGLPGHVLVKALSPIFFAREDTRTPMLAAAVGLVAALIGSVAFMAIGRPTGIALSVGLSGWISAAMLWSIAARRGLLDVGWDAWRRLILIFASALVMGIIRASDGGVPESVADRRPPHAGRPPVRDHRTRPRGLCRLPLAVRHRASAPMARVVPAGLRALPCDAAPWHARAAFHRCAIGRKTGSHLTRPRTPSCGNRHGLQATGLFRRAADRKPASRQLSRRHRQVRRVCRRISTASIASSICTPSPPGRIRRSCRARSAR